MRSSEPDAWTQSLVGRTLARRFRITRLLGAGGVGAVFEAEHLAMGRHVAIKVLHPELLERESVVERFHREARAAAACARAGVVQVLDLDEDPSTGPFLVMERLEGETLSDRLSRTGAMSPAQAAAIVVPVLETLAAVHARDIVHRDLKPGNVFLARDPEGREVVKVLDFGMARSAAGGRSSQLTLPGSVLGTPRYMAPEQAIGDPNVDRRADLYAIGALLYTCLAGQPPYADVRSEHALGAVLASPPEPLGRLRPSLPAPILAVVERAMQRLADQRYQYAEELLLALRAALDPTAVGPAPTIGIAAIPHLAEPSPVSGAMRGSVVTLDAPPHESPTVAARPGLRSPPAGQSPTMPVAVALPPPGGASPFGPGSSHHGSGSVHSPYGSTPTPPPYGSTPTPPPYGSTPTPPPGSLVPSRASGTRPFGGASAPPAVAAAPAPSSRGLLLAASIVGVLALAALVLAVALVVLTRRDARAQAESAPAALPPPPVLGPARFDSPGGSAADRAAAGDAPSWPPPAPAAADAAIPAAMQQALDRGRALAAAGRYDDARAAFADVERLALGSPDGSPGARALAYADLEVGDLYTLGITEIPPLESALVTTPLTSRMEARNQAIERYAAAMRRGHIDLNVCASVRFGRADERLADVYSRVRGTTPDAERLAGPYRDMAPRFLQGARDTYHGVASLTQYSPACAAAAREGEARATARLATMRGGGSP